jgi:surfactin synthase thioesterase subunit
MEQLAKKAAELALRLAALPADGIRRDVELLDAIEQLAVQIIKEVSAVRAGKTYAVGERSGVWRVVTPTTRQ